MKILLAVDDSPRTRRMLAYLARRKAWLAAKNEITVFHGVAPLPHRAAAFASEAVVKAMYDEDAEAVLGPVRTFLQRRGVEARYLHAVCRPAHEIARLARQQRADLIIMGSRPRGALARAVLGSVATKVMALTSTPVLVVR